MAKLDTLVPPEIMGILDTLELLEKLDVLAITAILEKQA
jgi:hypothetical protein